MEWVKTKEKQSSMYKSIPLRQSKSSAAVTAAKKSLPTSKRFILMSIMLTREILSVRLSIATVCSILKMKNQSKLTWDLLIMRNQFPPFNSWRDYFHKIQQDLNADHDTDQLSTSVDYLVELCNPLNSVEKRSSFANMSHQAVDFIIVSLKKFAKENKSGCIERTVNSLVTRVIGTLRTPSPIDESPHSGDEAQLYVHLLLCELGAEPYISQRIMFAVSQRILVLAVTLLFMDPFDDTFPAAHGCMFLFLKRIHQQLELGLQQYGSLSWQLTWTCISVLLDRVS